MKMVHLQGLNCYQDCIISIVNDLGIAYPLSFARLWPETDFRYDARFRSYTSARMLTDLAALGAELEIYPCKDPDQTAAAAAEIQPDEYFLVGMDAILIPWNPYYKTTHGLHYFAARQLPDGDLHCCDPTYHRSEERLSRCHLYRHAYEIGRIHRIPAAGLRPDRHSEARRILSEHPGTHRWLLAQINRCRTDDPAGFLPLARYVDTMISNRYLFRYYLEQHLAPLDRTCAYLRSDFLIYWFIVKNGLYKAAVSCSESLITEICNQLNELFDQEIAIAEAMI